MVDTIAFQIEIFQFGKEARSHWDTARGGLVVEEGVGPMINGLELGDFGNDRKLIIGEIELSESRDVGQDIPHREPLQFVVG